jgi:GNAT superfamily N-acetyltransferase
MAKNLLLTQKNSDREKSMTDLKISFVDQIPKEIEEKMEEGLNEYAISQGVDVNYKPFAFLLCNDKNEVIGVLDAFSSYSCIHIRDLWVDKPYRGKGYGRKLIAELEKYCNGKGFNNINLITCAFQAPDFYKKCGFEVEFVRKNIENPKLTMTFFIKNFDYTTES